jgi:hypothetical protein
VSDQQRADLIAETPAVGAAQQLNHSRYEVPIGPRGGDVCPMHLRHAHKLLLQRWEVRAD